MEQAKIEQQRIMEKERLKRAQQEEQRRYINEYREMKRRTDSLLLGNGGLYQPGGNFYSGFDQQQQNPAFYERHSNFGFPITTTTTNGAVITTMTGPGVNSSLNGPAEKMDPLAKLNADVKSGTV